MGTVSITLLTENQANVNSTEFNNLVSPLLSEFNGNIENVNVKSNAAIAYSKLNLTGNVLNADVSASAAIAFSKLASLTSAQILVGNGSNVPTAVAVSGDVAITNAGATTVTDLTITSEAENDTLYFDSSNWVRQANGRDGRIVSYNTSDSQSLSATATTTWTNSGLTGITFTPAQATNIIVIHWGFGAKNGSNNGGFMAAPSIGGTEQTAYRASNSSASNAATSIDYACGTMTTQLAASSQTITLEFRADTESGGTATAKQGFLHVIEYHYSS